MSEEIKNNQIPKEIKDICRSCEENIHCQNKGCAFRSLGNEYCDYVLNATKLYLDLQQKVEQLEKEKNSLMYSLTLVRQKWNNDKARYRRKAKVYREQRNQLENIRKEAIEECKSVIEDSEHTTVSEFNINGLMKTILNILNKGENNE